MGEFRMPSLGADMVAGTLTEWYKHPGDAIRRGDIIAAVDTDKGSIDVEVFEDGVLEQVVVQEGQKVPVGTLLAVIRSAGEAAALPAARAAAPAAGPPPPRPTAAATPRCRPGTGAPRHAPPGVSPGAPARGGAGRGPRHDPRVGRGRHHPPGGCRGRGVGRPRPAGADAAGHRGRDDPLQAGDSRTSTWRAPSTSVPPAPGSRSGTRSASRPTACCPRCSCSRPPRWRCSSFPSSTPDGRTSGSSPPRPSTSAWPPRSGAAGWWCRRCITSTGRRLPPLMQELRDLVQRARTGSLRSSDLTDGTITVTSLGERSADMVLGVIYPPQTAIVGFGAVVRAALGGGRRGGPAAGGDRLARRRPPGLATGTAARRSWPPSTACSSRRRRYDPGSR